MIFGKFWWSGLFGDLEVVLVVLVICWWYWCCWWFGIGGTGALVVVLVLLVLWCFGALVFRWRSRSAAPAAAVLLPCPSLPTYSSYPPDHPPNWSKSFYRNHIKHQTHQPLLLCRIPQLWALQSAVEEHCNAMACTHFWCRWQTSCRHCVAFHIITCSLFTNALKPHAMGT